MGEGKGADAAVADEGVAGHRGRGGGAADRRRHLGAARAAQIREHALQHRQVGIAVGAQGHDVFRQIDASGDVDGRAVAGHGEGGDGDDLAVEPDAEFAAVAQFVIEEAQPQVVDGRLDPQRIGRIDGAPDPHAAAAGGRGVGRERGHEHARVGVERGVRQAHRRLDLAGLGERQLPRARSGQARRGDVEAVEHLQPAQRHLRRHLPDALVADEQVEDADLHVVARLVEGAAAGGAEVGKAGQRRQGREIGQVERVDGQAAAVGVERVGPVPADVGGARDQGAGLLHFEPVEAHAGPLEAQAGHPGGERLVVGHAAIEGEAAEAERLLVLAVEMNLAAERPVDRVVVELEGVRAWSRAATPTCG